jgi:uncharacterized circularly permuted ATP-grasp superfamily protein
VDTVTGMFEGYDPEAFFDEAFDEGGRPRAHYAALVELLDGMGGDDFERRSRMRDATFRSRGVTFTLYDDDAGALERLFPMDLLPRIIPAAEWEQLERGLTQRVRALNLFLDDLYTGERAAVRDGVVPEWLVLSSDGFRREAFGIPTAGGVRCLVAGIDLVRDIDGAYRVLEDNLRNPSGVSYVLENRQVMTRLLPRVTAAHDVRPVDSYPASLLRALLSVAPTGVTDPRVVVLTPGIFNAAYFEHAFLAREMGVELVEGRDLLVDDGVVWLRTTRGLRRVDVIYRRLDDAFLDPVGFHSDTNIGVPGLVAAMRCGNVNVMNAIGNGVADDKAVYPFVGALVEYYLGERPILQSVPTYLPWEPDQLEVVLARLDQLVVKPVAGAGGYGLVMGPTANDAELAACRTALQTEPRGWIAQEVAQLSRLPTVCDDGVEGRHVDLRPFVLSHADGIEVLPGGLTRVALRKGSLVVNSSQGGGSKDTWVLVGNPAGEEPPS